MQVLIGVSVVCLLIFNLTGLASCSSMQALIKATEGTSDDCSLY